MFDLVIVTHIPCFYKVNLFNKIAERKKILIIFVSSDTENFRSNDFLSKDLNFNYVFLNNGFFESRNQLRSNFKLIKLLLSIKYKVIVVSGWDLVEFWVANMFFGGRHALILESSIKSSNQGIILDRLKKIFLSNLNFVIASGNQHCELLKLFNFKKEVRISKGVGLINKREPGIKNKKYERSFVYLGRVAIEKNLSFLIEVFNLLGPQYKLSIYGSGDMDDELKKLSDDNITFMGTVENSNLASVFSNYDFLILPSTYEPWGLVVEEALYYGIPAIVSDLCGCSDLIDNGVNGFLFNPTNKESLINIITSINEESYNYMKLNANSAFINNKDEYQISCYY